MSIERGVAVVREKAMDWLVVKKAGGEKSRSKRDAARVLGLPVVVINRPALPKANVVGSVNEALQWVRAQAW